MSINVEELKENLAEANPNAILFDDLDDALVGIATCHGMSSRAAYSEQKILELLQQKHQWSYDDAVEYYEFNIACLGVTDGTPVILQ